MTCAELRTHLLDHRRQRLLPDAEEAVRAHLESCPTCAAEDAAERALDEALGRRARHPASPGLKRRLAALVAERTAPAPSPSPAPTPMRRSPARWLAPALAAGLLVASGLLLNQSRRGGDAALALLTAEAVNDHLRVLYSQRPLEVESGGPHRVKPWFEGKLDFAPTVPEPAGLTLQGGSVGWFRDRKAAVLGYTLRLHKVTLLQFRAEGLPWPTVPGEVRAGSERGFHVFAWRAGDLGYALVSDASPAELSSVARTLARER